jgi:hypothetical protein
VNRAFRPPRSAPLRFTGVTIAMSPLRRIPVERLAALVASAAYGTVLVLATLSVIGAIRLSVGYGADLIAGVGIATWIAHIYAELLGRHVDRHRPLERSEVGRTMIDGCPILASPILPACALLLGKLDAISQTSARTAAIVVAIVQLLAIGFLVGRVAPARRSAVWIFAAVTVGIGIVVVALTTWLGH